MEENQQKKDSTTPRSPVSYQSRTVTEPYKPSRRAKKVLASLALLIFCFLAAFFGAWLAVTASDERQTALTSSKNDGNLVITDTERDIAAVVKKVSPSVVSIITSQSGGAGQQDLVGAGSGMVVSKDGYIMTNKHVIDGASQATVVLASGTVYKSVPVLGSDPLNDVAFLKIPNVTNLSPVDLGDSKTVRAGQEVIAIGNALGEYQNTVTSGIISGLGRPVAAQSGTGSVEELSDLLQTDAAINSGNSGGPLLNMQGQVIGINTAVAVDAQNIGFAIPIGAAKGMLKGVIENGKIQRAVIGVQYRSITPEIKEEYKLTVSRGDYVTAVSSSEIKNSVAKDAGIRENDIITQVNGVDVESGKSTSTLVGEFQPGETITLTILRDGKARDIKLTLGAY